MLNIRLNLYLKSFIINILIFSSKIWILYFRTDLFSDDILHLVIHYHQHINYSNFKVCVWYLQYFLLDLTICSCFLVCFFWFCFFCGSFLFLHVSYILAKFQRLYLKLQRFRMILPSLKKKKNVICFFKNSWQVVIKK